MSEAKADAAPDFTLVRVFTLMMRGLAQRPLLLLLAAIVTIYLPSVGSAYFLPWPEPAFSLEYVLWNLGFALVVSIAAMFQGLVAVQLSGGEQGPKALAIVAPMFPLLFALNLIIYLVSLVGLLALIVPGVIWSLATTVAIPAAAVERLAIGAALQRSLALTRTRRVMILVMQLALLAPLLIIGFAIDYALSGGAAAPPIVTYGSGPAMESVMAVAGALFNAAVYHELVRLQAQDPS